MKHRIWLVSLTLSFLIPACRPSISPAPTLAPPSAVPATATDTPTPVPTALPSVTPSPTSTLAFMIPREQRLNCRFAPDVVYAIEGTIEVGQETQIEGVSADGAWWYVRDPGNPGGRCWVLAELADASGDTSGVRVIAPEEATVRRIEMAVDPPHRSVACDAFPQTFYVTARITVDGPALVNWRWETSPGEVSPEQQLVFTESGSQLLENYFLAPAANAYTMKLHILSPNDVVEQIDFRVDCTP